MTLQVEGRSTIGVENTVTSATELDNKKAEIEKRIKQNEQERIKVLKELNERMKPSIVLVSIEIFILPG